MISSRSVETKHCWTGETATGQASAKTQCTCLWMKLWTRRASVCQELSARNYQPGICWLPGVVQKKKDRFHFESRCTMETWDDVTWIKYMAGPWKNCQHQRFLICWLMSCLMYLLTHQLKLLSHPRRLIHQHCWCKLFCLIWTMCRNLWLPLKFILLALVNPSITLNQLGHRQWPIVYGKFT